MNAARFRADAEAGKVAIDSHRQVLRIAYIYLVDGPWQDGGVFRTVEKLHALGWSFGNGNLTGNRTLDTFYVAQLMAAIHRSSRDNDDDMPGSDEFDDFYEQYHDLFDEDSWKDYYTPSFIMNRSSISFYRLPGLREIPDSGFPLDIPRPKPVGNHTKLPRWAYEVVRTHCLQPLLDEHTIRDLALSTLKQIIDKKRKEDPRIEPYSETQARFWLKNMGLEKRNSEAMEFYEKNRIGFGFHVAQGAEDIWAWEILYSPARWHSVEARDTYLEPDLDGSKKSEVMWCGWPDGGTGIQAGRRGWEPELGSEEEIEFLAAVAIKELEHVVEGSEEESDNMTQSQMFMRMLNIALIHDNCREHMDRFKTDFAKAEKHEVDDIEKWMQEVLKVMEPHTIGLTEKLDMADRLSLLKKILIENGQLFGRWRISSGSKNFDFYLKPQATEE